MANANKVETIYVELDCLLDTRLAVIAKLDAEAAANLANSASYFGREEDTFAGVDMEQYRIAYQHRDSSVLPYTIHTGMRQFLSAIVLELAEQAAATPLLDGVKVIVNSYPYLLGDAVKEEMVSAFNVWFGGFAPTTIIHAKPASLTPKHCKQNFSAMVIYDWNAWMNLHSEAFVETRLPEVLLYGPRLYTHVKPTEQELKEVMKEAPHPFEATEMHASPIIGLKLIDIAHFSSILRPH